MKKIGICAAALCYLLLTGCGSKAETVKDIDLTAFYEELAQTYGWTEDTMMDLDSEMLELCYPGLEELSAVQLVAKAPVMSYAVNEYVFLQCRTEADAERAAALLQARIDAQAGGDAWYPETVDQWKAASVITHGAYTALIASGEHQTEIEEAWNAQFGA